MTGERAVIKQYELFQQDAYWLQTIANRLLLLIWHFLLVHMFRSVTHFCCLIQQAQYSMWKRAIFRWMSEAHCLGCQGNFPFGEYMFWMFHLMIASNCLVLSARYTPHKSSLNLPIFNLPYPTETHLS